MGLHRQLPVYLALILFCSGLSFADNPPPTHPIHYTDDLEQIQDSYFLHNFQFPDPSKYFTNGYVVYYNDYEEFKTNGVQEEVIRLINQTLLESKLLLGEGTERSDYIPTRVVIRIIPIEFMNSPKMFKGAHWGCNNMENPCKYGSTAGKTVYYSWAEDIILYVAYVPGKKKFSWRHTIVHEMIHAYIWKQGLIRDFQYNYPREHIVVNSFLDRRYKAILEGIPLK